MSKARLVITAIEVKGRSAVEVVAASVAARALPRRCAMGFGHPCPDTAAAGMG